MDEDVLGGEGADHVAIVDRHVLEAGVRGLDEDLGFVAGGAEHALDAEYLVADRVAVPERGEDLVNADSGRVHAERS